jgi:uncharacterized protein (TIGR02117 family)
MQSSANPPVSPFCAKGEFSPLVSAPSLRKKGRGDFPTERRGNNAANFWERTLLALSRFIAARMTRASKPRLSLPRICGAALIALLLLGTSGRATMNWACAERLEDCKSVFIVHDAWHAAIVLAKKDISPDGVPELADLPQARFIEFSWGDKDYFPNPNAGVFAALRAAFWSSGSVLHVVGVTTDVKDFYPTSEIVELKLSVPAFARLQDFIAQTFSRPKAGNARPSAGLFPYSRFYPATRKFSLLKTCNTWVAEALESAGLPIVPSSVITAGQLAEQIDKATKPR